MKNLRKLSAFMVCLLLASCGTEPSMNNSETTDDTTTTEGSTETIRIYANLPELDFKGATVNFLVRGENFEPTNFSHEIYASEENGDVINDAVYRRNSQVEDMLNVVISETADNDSVDNVRASVLADDNMYDVTMIRPNRAIVAANEGLFYDLYAVPYLDMSAPWWDSNTVENLTINNRLFFVNGDINIMDNNAIWACMFNKKLFDDYSVTYPYDEVRNGSWTMDRFIEIAKLGGKDLDGNGEWDEFDQYGYINASDNIYALIVASGQSITAHEGDKTIINPSLEGIHTAYDKIISLTSDDKVTLNGEAYQSKGYKNVWSEVMRKSFIDGRGMLYVSGILSTTYLRDMKDEFGIVPLPKANKEQQEYRTVLHANNSSMLAIPVSNKQLDLTGAVCEALACESMYTLTPAYYDVTLTGKVARDDDSVEMLEIIIDSAVLDLVNLVNPGGISGIFTKDFMSGENTLTSDFDSKKSAAQTELEKFLDEYGK